MKARYLFFLLFLTATANAQKWQKGYVVLNSGERSDGWLLFDEFKYSAECQFKKEMNAELRRYTPDDLSGFGYEGYKTYRSILTGDERRVFAEHLMEGTVSLLRYREIFYAEKGDHKGIALIQKDTLLETSKGTRSYQDRKYVRTLQEKVFEQCADPTFFNRIQSSSYTYKSLRRLFTEYHACMKQPYRSLVQDIPKRKLQYGFAAGVVWSNVYFGDKDAVTPDMLEADQPLQWGWQAGGRCRMVFPRASMRRAFNLELVYQNARYELNHTSVTNAGNAVISTNDIRMQYVKLPFWFEQDFSQGRSSAYWGLGISLNVPFVRTHTKSVIFGNTNPNGSPEFFSYEPPVFYQAGLLLNGGIRFTAGRYVFPVELRTEWTALNASTKGTPSGSFKSANHLLFSLSLGILL
jgi:hypothetical protein